MMKMIPEQTTPCPLCRGAGLCRECHGRGVLTCVFCDGLGCDDCDGSGAVTCVPCDGRGNCWRCEGRGEVTAPLTYRN